MKWLVHNSRFLECTADLVALGKVHHFKAPVIGEYRDITCRAHSQNGLGRLVVKALAYKTPEPTLDALAHIQFLQILAASESCNIAYGTFQKHDMGVWYLKETSRIVLTRHVGVVEVQFL